MARVTFSYDNWTLDTSRRCPWDSKAFLATSDRGLVAWVSETQVVPTARATDPITSHMAAKAQTPNKVRAEHRVVLELLQYEPLTDFELATRASQALHKTVKQTSIGVRRGELVRVGLVRDSGRKGLSDTGHAAILWELTASGRRELAS